LGEGGKRKVPSDLKREKEEKLWREGPTKSIRNRKNNGPAKKRKAVDVKDAEKKGQRGKGFKKRGVWGGGETGRVVLCASRGGTADTGTEEKTTKTEVENSAAGKRERRRNAPVKTGGNWLDGMRTSRLHTRARAYGMDRLSSSLRGGVSKQGKSRN